MKYGVLMITIMLYVYLLAKSAEYLEHKTTIPITPAQQNKIFNDGWPIWVPT